MGNREIKFTDSKLRRIEGGEAKEFQYGRPILIEAWVEILMSILIAREGTKRERIGGLKEI